MRIRNTLFASTMLALTSAFDNKAGWKMEGDNLALDGSGNPIYVQADGREMSVEQTTISRLNGEAKTNRERAEAAEKALEPYKDLDATAARKAIETVANIDQSKLIDAGKLDEVKNAITQQYEGKLTEANNTVSTLQQRVDNMTLSSAFKGSSFIAEKVAVPPEMFEATFARNFKVENGKVVPYDANGNVIYSKARMSEIADVDEAFEILVDTYKHKDQILKAPDISGSGNRGGGGNRGGSRVMKRSEFEALDPHQMGEAAAAMGKGEMTIVD